jgi:heme-degrading monooxygenase HmoA
MSAFNVVRFRVKAGRDREFLDAHRHLLKEWPGLRRVSIIKTGENAYCLIAEWVDMDAIAKARPQMIATLNGFREVLEDLGEGKGVTDAVSGEVALALG